jgi:8-oxo-dGTP diphosphatase
MSMPLKWEFPGGKIRANESPEECLRRELREELGVTVRVGQALPPSTHRYPSFAITPYPFLCAIESGGLILHEHAEIAWMKPQDLLIFEWADADRPVVDAFLRLPARNSE